MTSFSSTFEQEVFFAVYLIWIATFFLENWIILSAHQSSAKRTTDRGSRAVIYLTVFLSIAIAYSLAHAGIALLPDSVFYHGITLMILGILVREWSVVTLRTYFSYTVTIRQNHKVVEKGPYAMIRHPAYSGSMLTILGTGVALRSWIGILALILLSSVAYGYRIHVEEKALMAELGEAYTEYMKRTKRVIPFIV